MTGSVPYVLYTRAREPFTGFHLHLPVAWATRSRRQCQVPGESGPTGS